MSSKKWLWLSADPCRCHCRGRRPRQRSISSGLFSFTGRQFRSWRRHDQLPFEGTICPAVPCSFGVAKRFWAFWLAFEPCSIGVSKRANGSRPSGPSRSLPSFTAMRRVLFPELAAALGILLSPLEGDLMSSDRAAARSLPSFTAMLLKRGEGCFFPSWRLLLASLFISRYGLEGCVYIYIYTYYIYIYISIYLFIYPCI